MMLLGLIQRSCFVAGWSLGLLAIVSSSAIGDQPGTSRSGASELRIYPATVSPAADYPAQVTLIESFADGTTIDRTHDPDFAWTIESGSNIARCNDQRMIEAVSAGDAVLRVSRGDQQLSVSIHIEDSAPRPILFAREVSAVMGKMGCNLGTCHGNLHGKGGFRLSLRGDDPVFDFTAITRDRTARRIDLFSLHSSLLLRKPAGEVAHQGGTKLPSDSPGYAWIQRWLNEGAAWSDSHNNEVSSVAVADAVPSGAIVRELVVEPRNAFIRSSGRSQQLVVLAKFADGTTRDVTRWARFDPSVVEGIDISPAGLVSVKEPMDVAIAISYLNGRSASRLTFLAHDSSPEWSEPSAASKIDALVEDRVRSMQLRPEPVADAMYSCVVCIW